MRPFQMGSSIGFRSISPEAAASGHSRLSERRLLQARVEEDICISAIIHNLGATMRLHQYIRLFPAATVDPFWTVHDRYAAPRILKDHPSALNGVGLSPLAKRLVGEMEW